jgi:hypothetical protein
MRRELGVVETNIKKKSARSMIRSRSLEDSGVFADDDSCFCEAGSANDAIRGITSTEVEMVFNECIASLNTPVITPPTDPPSTQPSVRPSAAPSAGPSVAPSDFPTEAPCTEELRGSSCECARLFTAPDNTYCSNNQYVLGISENKNPEYDCVADGNCPSECIIDREPRDTVTYSPGIGTWFEIENTSRRDAMEVSFQGFSGTWDVMIYTGDDCDSLQCGADTSGFASKDATGVSGLAPTRSKLYAVVFPRNEDTSAAAVDFDLCMYPYVPPP